MLTVLPLVASDPGTAALAFLEKLRTGNVDYGPDGDTALQANTSKGKQEQIRKQLERVARGVADGRLELGDIKQDGDYAGVLVRKIGSYDSSDMNVFPIALVRENGKWMPAPVVASFENAVTGYTTQVKKRLEALEIWMLRQRVEDLEFIISESGERMRREILEEFPPEQLTNESPRKFVEGFLEACKTGNQAAILGYLGGLEKKKPEDWSERLKVSEMVNDRTIINGFPWRLVVSEEVVREVVHEDLDERGGTISIACLDPALVSMHGSLSKIKLLHISVRKGASDRFLINLPQALILNDMDELHTDEDLDVDLLDLFTTRLRGIDGAKGSESPEIASKSVIEGLKTGNLRTLLTRVDFEGTAKKARIAATSAAEIWWSVNDPSILRIPVQVGFKEQGDLAMASYQWFSMTYPDRFELRTFTFKKTSGGWMWVPGIVSRDEREDQDILNEWAKKSSAEWEKGWMNILMRESVRLEKIDTSRLVTDEDAEELMEQWNMAMRSGKIESALGLSAWCDSKGGLPVKLLRNINYAVTDAREVSAEFHGIFRNDSWVAVAVKHTGDKETYFSFHPIVLTAEGPKMLPEIDLIVGRDRTRRFLNEQVFKKLGENCDPEEVSELEGLFQTFSEQVESE